MKSFEELTADVRNAMSRSDAYTLRELAEQLQAVGTPKALAVSYNARGAASQYTGDYVSAMEHYRNALNVCEELDDRAGVARVSVNLGNVCRNTGHYASALDHYQRALTVREELGDRLGMAVVAGAMGDVYNSTGDYPLALEHFRKALAVHEELGDRTGVANATNGMGVVYQRNSDYSSALEQYRSALSVFEELADRAGVARVTGNMGIVYASTGDHAAAVEHFQRVLAVYEQLDDRAGAARVIGNLIEALMNLRLFDEATAMLERQVVMHMDDPGVRSAHSAHFAAIAEHQQDLDAAQRHLSEALEIARTSGIRADAASYHEKLRDLAQKRNDFAGYIEHNNEFLRITEEIRGKEATQKLAMMEAERKMEGERRERDKERALLYGALPKAVADRMIRGEKITGDHFEHAAVLFIDVASFTAHTSAMPPGDVVLLLEDVFSRIDSICDRHGAVKVKTIGDSYMCFCGDADAHTNALCMMHVALDVQKMAFTWPDGSPLVVRMGAHIGPATAGVIGTQRLQYDVWGDTVNVASRMESSGEPGRIHVSEVFASFLGLRPRNDSTPHAEGSEGSVIPNEVRNEEPGTWHVALRGETELKGKGTMTTYWLDQPNENL